MSLSDFKTQTNLQVSNSLLKLSNFSRPDKISQTQNIKKNCRYQLDLVLLDSSFYIMATILSSPKNLSAKNIHKLIFIIVDQIPEW